jgi:hypothetical protein
VVRDDELEAIVHGITDAVLGHVRRELSAVFMRLETAPSGTPSDAVAKQIDTLQQRLEAFEARQPSLELTKRLDDLEMAVSLWAMPTAIATIGGIEAVQGKVGRDGSYQVADRALFTKKLETLETRLGELEQRPAITYRELWQPGVEYKPGDAVTCDGSMWIALTPTSARPGAKDNSMAKSWRLAVKRGRDGHRGHWPTKEPLDDVRG